MASEWLADEAPHSDGEKCLEDYVDLGERAPDQPYTAFVSPPWWMYVLTIVGATATILLTGAGL